MILENGLQQLILAELQALADLLCREVEAGVGLSLFAGLGINLSAVIFSYDESECPWVGRTSCR